MTSSLSACCYNLEMLGNLRHAREKSLKWSDVRGLRGEKLFWGKTVYEVQILALSLGIM